MVALLFVLLYIVTRDSPNVGSSVAPSAPAQSTVATNSPERAESLVATNSSIEKFKADVQKAQREIEEMRSKQIIDMAKNYALPKLKDKSTFQYLETDERVAGGDNLYVVRFMGDGRKFRVGIREDDAGELSIVPRDEMQSVVDSSKPRE